MENKQKEQQQYKKKEKIEKGMQKIYIAAIGLWEKGVKNKMSDT